MFREFFAQSDLLIWPLVALGIFFVAFMVVLIRVAVGFKRGTRLDHVAGLPLEQDTPVPAAPVRERRV